MQLKWRPGWTLALLLLSGPVLADGAAILRCRAQADPAQRFACYEAIAVPTATPRSPAAAPALTPPAPSPQTFGLEQKMTPAVLDLVESRIPGAFYGWGPQERILLANGQVWQVTDDSRGALVARDPNVTIRRGALGAFYLEIEGTNRSPKVRRIE